MGEDFFSPRLDGFQNPHGLGVVMLFQELFVMFDPSRGDQHITSQIMCNPRPAQGHRHRPASAVPDRDRRGAQHPSSGMPGLLHTSGGVPQTPTRRWERKRGGCCFNELTPPRYLRRQPSNTCKAPLVTCRATLDVTKTLFRYLARPLRAHRRALGTRANTRSLTCYNQAILILRHYRDRTDPTRLATDHTISRATAYRYIDEGTTVLANQAPDLHQALQQAQE